jgi:hypothetical protein
LGSKELFPMEQQQQEEEQEEELSSGVCVS